jgi:hypothetical protein
MSQTPEPKTDKAQTITGKCMCEKVKFSISGQTAGLVNCHCKQCQRLHGNYNPMLVADKENLVITEGQEHLKTYNSSEDAERLFCDLCGSCLFKKQVKGPKILISAGSLDDTTGLKTLTNIFTESAGEYYDMPEVK